MVTFFLLTQFKMYRKGAKENFGNKNRVRFFLDKSHLYKLLIDKLLPTFSLAKQHYLIFEIQALPQ